MTQANVPMGGSVATYIKMLTAAGLTCTVLGLSGCGSDSQSSDGKSSGNSDKPTLTIQAPGEGSNVKLPITLKFTTSKDIGPTDSGKDHVHVFIDGKTNEYTVVTSTTYTIKSMPMGKHVIGVTLQHADHSPAGASAQVSVNVTGGRSGGGGTPSSTPSYPTGGGGNDNYDY